MGDLFAAPEGLNDYQPGTWPSPVKQTLDCGCTVEPDAPVGKHEGELLCEPHLEDAWEDESAWWSQACHCGEDGHGGPF